MLIAIVFIYGVRLRPKTSNQGLDPELRKKLLSESRTPWRGPRRLLWATLFASSSVGLLIMVFRSSTNQAVSAGDVGVQILALLICGTLLWFERDRGDI